MAEAAMQLKLAGHTYRVVTSADEDELERLTHHVESALAQVTPEGRQPSTHSLVLAAITLAHELEEERARRQALETRHRSMLGSLLGRIDQALTSGRATGTRPSETPARSLIEASGEEAGAVVTPLPSAFEQTTPKASESVAARVPARASRREDSKNNSSR